MSTLKFYGKHGPDVRGKDDVECRFRPYFKKTRTADGTVTMTPIMATISSADEAIAVRSENCDSGKMESGRRKGNKQVCKGSKKIQGATNA